MRQDRLLLARCILGALWQRFQQRQHKRACDAVAARLARAIDLDHRGAFHPCVARQLGKQTCGAAATRSLDHRKLTTPCDRQVELPP